MEWVGGIGGPCSDVYGGDTAGMDNRVRRNPRVKVCRPTRWKKVMRMRTRAASVDRERLDAHESDFGSGRVAVAALTGSGIETAGTGVEAGTEEATRPLTCPDCAAFFLRVISLQQVCNILGDSPRWHDLVLTICSSIYTMSLRYPSQ